MLTLLLALAVARPSPTERADADRAGAYLHFSLAQQARLSGELDEALAEYRKAQRLDPQAGEIRADVARLLQQTGHSAEALAEAEAAVKAAPDSPDAHLVLAQLRHMAAEGPGGEQTLRQAAAEYEQALRLDPTDVATLLILANNVYPALQEHEKAIAAWKKFLDLTPGSFEAYVQLGTQYLAKGEAENAASALQKAVELDPSSSRAYQTLGDIYARAQQNDQAILNYRKALELDPKNVRLHLALGEVLGRARRNPEALKEAEAVLAVDAKNRFALDMQARALRDMRQFDRADAVADALLAQDPSDIKASYLKVTILEGRRDFAGAAKAVEALLARPRMSEQAAEAAGTDRVFLVHLGFAYEQLERYKDAADAFGRAVNTGGEDPDANLLGQYVDALVLAKEQAKALSEVRAARAKFPEDPELVAAEANVLRSGGDVEAGVAAIEKLRQRSPDNVGVLVEVADFYQKAKRYADAERILRHASEVEPRNLRVLFQLGAVLERLRRIDAAETVFREALSVEPDSAPVLNYLGYMNADRGVRLEEALQLIEKAIALDPENGAYLDSLGWAMFRLDRVDKAEQFLRRAVDKPGANAVVLDHLGDVLRRRGSVREAVEYWRKALQAEDEGEDLDRAGVERKIRDAMASLHDSAQSKQR